MNNVNHLVMSTTIDYSSDLICAELEARGQKYVRLNRDRFVNYIIEFDLQKGYLVAKVGDTEYILHEDSIHSVYFRAPVFYRTSGKPYTVDEQLKRSQWSAFIRNLIVFGKAKWINHPVSIYRAENKLLQLKLAKQCGLAVPNTFLCNSLPGSVKPENTYIVKSLDTALFHDGNCEMFTYSTMVSGHELQDAEIKIAPVIIQEYLSSKIDLRVTVIGEQIFPVSITKHGEAIAGDWRKNSKDNLKYTPIQLPSETKIKIIKLMKNLGLSFGGIDLALVDDEFYFIEVNPTGEWGWLVSSAGLPIEKAIVDYMIKEM